MVGCATDARLVVCKVEERRNGEGLSGYISKCGVGEWGVDAICL